VDMILDVEVNSCEALKIMSCCRSVVPTIDAVEIMDYALFLPWCVVDLDRCLDWWC
jgi:hypothetical protein